MHVNQKIGLLIRASRLYCHSMYQKYDPKYYPTIKGIVLNFTNKLFGTKPVENKVRIDIISLFSDDIKDRPGWKVYSGICILVEFPDIQPWNMSCSNIPSYQKEISITNRFSYQLRPNK